MIKLFSYLSIYYYRGQRYKLILNLQTLSKFLCFQLLIIAQDDVGGESSFLSSLKETKQRKVQKRPELRGRNTNSSNHSMRSALPLRLRRTRYAQTAFRISFLRLRPAIRDSITIQRICIPLKTSSCGMFLSVSEKT